MEIRIGIHSRGDSGIAREELMEWCEANGVDYVFELAKNDRFKRWNAPQVTSAERMHRQKGRAGSAR